MYRFPTGSREMARLGPGWREHQYRLLNLRPLGRTVGVELVDVDMNAMTEELFAEIDMALMEWKVVIARHQFLSREKIHEVVSRWGPVVEDSLPRQVQNKGTITPIEQSLENVVSLTRNDQQKGQENVWHVDASYREQPVLCTFLSAEDVPKVG
jgi:alpha-ketoglutarate-dependent taurine dioxygenase